MNKLLLAALDKVDNLSRWLIIACMATMISLISAQVLLRYGFSWSIDWAEEVSRLAFVWAVFMAIAHGVKLGAHVGIDAATKHLPELLKRCLQLATYAVSAALMAIVAFQAGMAASENWDQLMPTINLSSGWFYLAVSVGCAHSAIHLCAQLLCPRCMPQALALETAQ